MQHLLLKAATTAATDQGTFEAVISAASIDREKDIVDPAGMVRALHKWVATGKNIPLAWQHSGAAEDQIGYIDPASARVVAGEVVVKGWIDQSSEVGAHAWRLVKMGTLGFSFGYLIPTGGATKRAGGGSHIKEMDVFEVTASPTPMNNDTRVLGWKAAVDVEETEQDTLETVIELIGDFLDTEDDAQDIAAARDILARLQALLAAENAETPDANDAAKALRAKADAVALEHATGGANLDAPAETETEPEPTVPEIDPGASGKAIGTDQGVPVASLLITVDEMHGYTDGHVKAVWTSAYVNDLPDSAFLYIEDGGSKDSAGKTTPRNLRHFPYKDANGNTDLPHLRNALARIPQSSLSPDVKDKLTSKAQRLLDAQKSVDATGKEHPGARSVDPLRAKADALALELASGGESLKKPPQPAKKAPPPDLIPLEELKQRMRHDMLTALSGMDIESE